MIKLLVAGDFCPRGRVEKHVSNGEYEYVLGEVKPYTSSVDYSIVNLEAPVVGGNVKPIDKKGPHLKCSSNVIEAIKYAGFNMVTLANNHFYDYGDEGVKETLKTCNSYNIDTVGGGMNIMEASRVVYKTIKGVIVSFINCCEHEFSIATESTAGANPLEPVLQYYAIKEARKKSDIVMVIVHGGHEGYQLPSPRMKETYSFFIDCGADVVINHHQHCFSGYEIYKDRPIFYGTGNFCFDKLNGLDLSWSQGYMVELTFSKGISFQFIPYIQCYDEAKVMLLDAKRKEAFTTRINELNEIINDMSRLKEAHKQWMGTTVKGYELVFSPYSNRFLAALCSRGLLPKFLYIKKRLSLINYIECEAHRERTIYMLKNIK